MISLYTRVIELMFKRTVSSPIMGHLKLDGFYFKINLWRKMNLYIYPDDSRVFDKVHNNFYVCGGIICLNKEQKN